jgi:hypothetical protein
MYADAVQFGCAYWDFEPGILGSGSSGSAGSGGSTGSS